MVLRLCLRILQHEQDAEDAFQATFLVLSRKAGSLRPQQSLCGWLHSVAYRIAQKARVDAARRRKHEGRAAARQVADPLAEITLREAHEVLDQELARLPDKFRAPLVLCYLEGLTRDEAAHRLGWSPSTLKSRLEQARERLRARLAARGLALSGALVASLFGEATASAAVPSVLLDSTVKAATSVAAGGAAASVVSAKVAALTEGVLQAMFFTKLQLAAAFLLAAGVFLAAGGLAGRHILAAAQVGEPSGSGAKRNTLGAARRVAKANEIAQQEWMAKAQRAVSEIKELELQASLLIRLAKAQSRLGEREAASESFAKARLLSEKIHDTYRRGTFLALVARDQAQTGDISGAFDTAEAIARIPDQQAEDLKYAAWWSIATEQAKRGDFQAALTNVDRIKGSDQDYAWRDITLLQAKASRFDDALRTAERIQAPFARAETWAELAKELHARKHAAAKQCLRNAIQAMQGVDGDPFKMMAESHVLGAQAALGEIEEALRAAKESRNDYALLNVAQAQAKAGNVDEAVETARLIVTETTRDFAFRGIASVASFDQTKKLIEELKHNWMKTAIWIKVGQRYADKGAHPTARLAFRQAVALSGQVTDPPNVVHARLGSLLDLAEAMARAGFLDDAAALAEGQREPVYRAGVLVGILAGTQKK